MAIELTKDQQAQLDKETHAPAPVRDPRGNVEYVLVPAETYEQMLEIVEDDAEQRALRRAAARATARRLSDDNA